jgi:hypothetical protein
VKILVFAISSVPHHSGAPQRTRLAVQPIELVIYARVELAEQLVQGVLAGQAMREVDEVCLGDPYFLAMLAKGHIR